MLISASLSQAREERPPSPLAVLFLPSLVPSKTTDVQTPPSSGTTSFTVQTKLHILDWSSFSPLRQRKIGSLVGVWGLAVLAITSALGPETVESGREGCMLPSTGISPRLFFPWIVRIRSRCSLATPEPSSHRPIVLHEASAGPVPAFHLKQYLLLPYIIPRSRLPPAKRHHLNQEDILNPTADRLLRSPVSTP